MTNADSNTEIVANVTLTNRILAGSYIRVKVPLEQFSRTTDTIQFMETGGSSPTAMTVVSTDSTHVTLEFEEFCSGADALCADGTTMSITITQGFKNARTVLSSFSQYFVFQSVTTDKVYQVDESTDNIVASPSISEAAITSISVSFESATTTHEGYADIYAVLGSTVLSTDYIELSFDSEFLLQTSNDVT